MALRAAGGHHLRGPKYYASCVCLLTAMAVLAACQDQEADAAPRRCFGYDPLNPSGLLHDMATRPDEYTVQLDGLKGLADFSDADIEHSTQLSRALVCRLAASAMHHWSLDRDMQVQAMCALHKCAVMKRRPHVLGSGEREACALVIEALDTFLYDVDAQRNGLAAMHTLISPSGEDTKPAAAEGMMDVWDHMVEHGAAHIIAASMRTHTADAEVVSNALDVMRYLSRSRTAASSIVQSGWVELAVGALRAFPKDATITFTGVGVLVNLAARTAPLDRFYEAGAWLSASAAMKRHKDDARLQRVCLLLAAILAGHEGLRWQLGEDSACEAVLTSMRASEGSLEIQLAGLRAIGSLSGDYQPFMGAGDMGRSSAPAQHPWLGDVTQEAGDPGSNPRAYAAPDKARNNPHWNRIRFVEGGAVDVVSSAMRRFPEDGNVQMRAVRVLSMIGKNARGPSYAVVQLIDKALEKFRGDRGWRYELRVEGQRAKEYFSGGGGGRPGM